MLTAITYNCTPDSLGDVTPEEFVDAFENEIRAVPKFRDLSVSVTFSPAVRSEVTVFESDDTQADISHEEELRDRFDRIAEKAFNACLTA